MKTITVRGPYENYQAVVDDQDFELVSQYVWRTYPLVPSGKKYAIANVSGGRPIPMHRLILNPPPDKQVDHKNGDSLDNRRNNLRLATPSQNAANREGTREGYKGVVLNKGRWIAQIGYQHTKMFLGSYDTEMEAARAYDAKARELFGEFALTNFSA